MNLFGAARKNEQGFTFRKMKPRDVEPALHIIEDHDEDDAEAAAYSMSGDLSGFYVVEAEGRVAGVTGYSRIMDAPTSAWLSWTYVHDDMRKRGIGSFMMEELRFALAKTKVERLFIETSDYTEDGVDIYAEARRFYERCGATRELVIEDFYQPGESRYIYRLALEMNSYFTPEESAQGSVVFTDIDVMQESDTAFGLYWEEIDNEPDDARERLQALIDEAKGEGAHAIFASLPSQLSLVAASQLQSAGFQNIGNVSDFYGPGAYDSYWALYLNR